jgi:hypothetical protein
MSWFALFFLGLATAMVAIAPASLVAGLVALLFLATAMLAMWSEVH